GVHSVGENGNLACRNVALRIFERRERVPQVAAGVEASPIVGGISGDETIVVVRVPLGLHQPLLASLRAADIVAAFGRFVVERAGDLLRVDRGHMETSVSEILDELVMPERPRGAEPLRVHLSGTGARAG